MAKAVTSAHSTRTTSGAGGQSTAATGRAPSCGGTRSTSAIATSVTASNSPPTRLTGASPRRHNQGTPEEVEFVVQLSNAAPSRWTRTSASTVLNRIINSCDGNDPENPLNLASSAAATRAALSRTRSTSRRPTASSGYTHRRHPATERVQVCVLRLHLRGPRLERHRRRRGS